MVRIPYIKIPSVRVGSIVPTSNIGTGGAAPAPPTPVTYLTQWKIVGNSEVHGNEIWSCGEYNATDDKYHILVQPLGGSIADIALDEPLRKVNDVADSIEFANGTATLTRNLGNMNWQNAVIRKGTSPVIQFQVDCSTLKMRSDNILSSKYPTKPYVDSASTFGGFGIAGYSNSPLFRVVDEEYDSLSAEEFLNNVLSDTALIYELATPTTETIQVPQIEEAESYSCVISQGGKAVEWSSFITNSE